MLKIEHIVLAAFLIATTALASPSLAPADLVPQGFKVVESIHADLNRDGVEDIILLIKLTDQSGIEPNKFNEMVDRNRRGLIIALKKGSKYAPTLRNLSCFSSENEDGGVYFPPDLIVSSQKGNLQIKYHHGRYGYVVYTFRLKNGDFELIGYDSSTNHGPVVEKFTSINLLSNKVLTRVNTNEDAQGGDERFKESWKYLKKSKAIKLSEIADFEELAVMNALGVSQ